MDFIPPKFIVRGVFATSNKCRMTLTIQILRFFVIHGLSVECFLITLCGRYVSIAEFRSFGKTASLSPAVVADKTMFQFFSVIHRHSARHVLSRISTSTSFPTTLMSSLNAYWSQLLIEIGLGRSKRQLPTKKLPAHTTSCVIQNQSLRGGKI